MNAVLPPAHRTSEELTIFTEAAKLAKIGNAGIEETAYTVASAMNALHDRASDASQAIGELNAIVGAGDMTLQDLEEAMKSGILPTAKAFGLQLNSVGGALRRIRRRGDQGRPCWDATPHGARAAWRPDREVSGNPQGLGLSVTEIKTRSKATSEELTKLGLSQTQIATDLTKPNGLSTALRDLKTHMDELGMSGPAQQDAITRMFGGGRTSSGITLLINNLDRLEAKEKQVQKQGTAKKFAEDWAKDPSTP